MWLTLLPYFTDSFLAFLAAGPLLATSICVVAWALLRLIPKDEATQLPYRRFRLVVILATGILAFAAVGIAVALFALFAFGRPPASPALEFFEENPAQREHQPRHSNQRHADGDDGGDEYGVAVQLYAQIGDQCGDQENPGEDNESLLHPLEFLEPAAVGGGWSRRRGFRVGGRLQVFAGKGGIVQFGGSHNRAILTWGGLRAKSRAYNIATAAAFDKLPPCPAGRLAPGARG